MAWLLGPFALLTGLVLAGVKAAVAPFLLVALVIYPYASWVRRVGPAAGPVFTSGTALAFALLQWGLVTVMFALLTRRLSAAYQWWLAPLVVVAMAVVVSLVASWLGITVPPWAVGVEG